jgi:hypothetical protein
MIFRWLFIFILFFIFQIESKEDKQSLVYSKKTIIENYFYELLEHTPAGYVLYGRKPVYLNSFCELEKIFLVQKHINFLLQIYCFWKVGKMFVF